MSVELLLILLGVPATIATAYFSLSDEKNQRRKWYRAAALALAILNVVAAIEVYYQSENVQRLSANVDRRWTVATHLPIDHLEFELLFPDGAVPVGDVSGALSWQRLNLTDSPCWRTMTVAIRYRLVGY